MPTKLVNLTPYEIGIANDAGEIVRRIPSSGVARLVERDSPRADRDGVPLVHRTFFEKLDGFGLSARASSTVNYIVSLPVLMALRNVRDDLLAPDTGSTAIRNENGGIVAVRRLIC